MTGLAVAGALGAPRVLIRADSLTRLGATVALPIAALDGLLARRGLGWSLALASLGRTSGPVARLLAALVTLLALAALLLLRTPHLLQPARALHLHAVHGAVLLTGLAGAGALGALRPLALALAAVTLSALAFQALALRRAALLLLLAHLLKSLLQFCLAVRILPALPGRLTALARALCRLRACALGGLPCLFLTGLTHLLLTRCLLLAGLTRLLLTRCLLLAGLTRLLLTRCLLLAGLTHLLVTRWLLLAGLTHLLLTRCLLLAGLTRLLLTRRLCLLLLGLLCTRLPD